MRETSYNETAKILVVRTVTGILKQLHYNGLWLGDKFRYTGTDFACHFQ